MPSKSRAPKRSSRTSSRGQTRRRAATSTRSRRSTRTESRTSRSPAMRARSTMNQRSNARRGSSAGRKSAPQRSELLTKTTTDHDEIRQWAEERGAHPASVKRTNRDRGTGIIRLDFPGYSGGDSLQEISWEQFFEKFDDSNLALIYQETTAEGERSNFNKLVKRANAKAGSSRKRRTTRAAR